MEPKISDQDIAKDVLHNQDHSRLSQEEIAKAIAHHNRRHKEDAGPGNEDRPRPAREDKSK